MVYLPGILNSLVYSGVGIFMLIAAFVIADVLTPHYSLWKEIVEKQNVALSILLGCFLIGVALVIAAAVHG